MTTLVLQPPTKDTPIVNGAVANNNWGVSTILYIGEQNNDVYVYRTLIQFDLTTLPADATINSAILSLYLAADYSSNARTYRVYRVKDAWVEGTRDNVLDNPATGSTWNRRDLTTNWQVAGCSGANDREATDIGSIALTASEAVGWKDISLTPTTKANIDLGYGWLLKADTETNDMYIFASKDNANPSLWPKLTIDYTPAVPEGVTRASSKKVTLIDYASPDLIPAGLRKVGIVSAATLPANLKVVDPTWVASRDLAAPDQVVYGAVRYASADLISPELLPLGVEA